MITTSSLANRIAHLYPCSDASVWLNNYTDPITAWRKCQRGDWMLWLIGKTINSPPWSDDRKPLLACAIDCALTVKHLWPKKHQDKIESAILALQGWIVGTIPLADAKIARHNIYVHADAAAAAAADAAYGDAAAAADAAYAAATAAAAAAADAAATATAAAAYAAAAAAAGNAVRTQILATCADIIRQHYPEPPEIQ